MKKPRALAAHEKICVISGGISPPPLRKEKSNFTAAGMLTDYDSIEDIMAIKAGLLWRKRCDIFVWPIHVVKQGMAFGEYISTSNAGYKAPSAQPEMSNISQTSIVPPSIAIYVYGYQNHKIGTYQGDELLQCL